MAIFVKDPAALVDYAVDWTAGYLVNQTITSSAWRVVPDGAGTIVVEAQSIEPGRTTATLSGGRNGCLYHVTNTVGTSDGRTDERTLVVRVEDR
ncbi:MAG: hypothetical protein H7268_03980 [Sandarakinorhabdus sp.]|nr:hypothetical protein [Sandarakinorhabdus sp.]